MHSQDIKGTRVMNKKVCIKISGLHSAESDDGTASDDNIEVINIGSYYKRNGKHYVKYEEPIEMSDKSNFNLLKISDNEVELIARGPRSTHMVFTRGQKNMNFYQTPFGGLNLGVDTYELSVAESDDSIVVDIGYGLEVNLDYVNQCKVHIESLNDDNDTDEQK